RSASVMLHPTAEGPAPRLPLPLSGNGCTGPSRSPGDGRTGSPRTCGKARGATDGRAPGQRRGRCGRSRLDLLRLPVATGMVNLAIDRAGPNRSAAFGGVDSRIAGDVLTGARAGSEVAEHAPVVEA